MLGVPVRRSVVAYNGYTSGIGNRIRVVLGSLSVAELEHRDLYYVWPTGQRFGPSFTDLWEFREGRTVSRATSRLLARRWQYLDEDVPAWLTERKRRELVWQIRTGSELVLPVGARPWADRFRALTPVTSIADRIRSEFEGHLRGRPYVGVMVRAHAVSHRKTLESSPVEWFVERMQQLRAADPDLRFFLSCDTPEVQERIAKEIGGCYGLRDKGAYNSTSGVRSAVCDLYLLAGAGHLIGPHFSSFVELARKLSGGRLALETPLHPISEVDVAAAGLVRDPVLPHDRR